LFHGIKDNEVKHPKQPGIIIQKKKKANNIIAAVTVSASQIKDQ